MEGRAFSILSISNFLFRTINVIWISLTDTGRKPQKGPTVACEGSVAHLRCDKGEVIYVRSATYGRRDQKTCTARRPANQITNVRCSRSSDRVGQRCNGKQRCNVRASYSMFGDPCVGTYKYLEVDYICY
ncbi:hypothetical protein CCH79_00017094, partial [Gambusia affinis]